MSSEIITALDIGSTFVRVIICEYGVNGILNVLGSGVRPSTGLRKGIVVNIEATVRAINSAIEDAEMMSGYEVKDCWIGIGGNHINSINSRGVVGVIGKKKSSKEKEIGQEDIDRVIEAAKAVNIPTDRQILEIIPQSYKVDDQKGIRNPLDMIGVRLESDVHLITCSVTGAHNLVNCVNRASFKVNEVILQSLAAAQAVLTPEEMELGVVLLDLGGGTTDAIIYTDGTPFSTYTVPAGGTQVTSDISIMKGISIENAEKIKIDAGCCWEPMLDSDKAVIIPGVGGRQPMEIPCSKIFSIIKPRMEEIFKIVKQHLDSLNVVRPFGGGVVLTGGGAQLLGVVELATHILKLPARLGTPLPIPKLSGLADVYKTPSYATVIGLVLEGDRRSCLGTSDYGSETRDKKNPDLVNKLKAWLKNEFL